jgi:hypothetical protein
MDPRTILAATLLRLTGVGDEGPCATLINATGHTWQAQLQPWGTAGRVTLTLSSPDRPAETIPVPDPGDPPVIPLVAGAGLRIAHGEAPGRAVSRWLELWTGAGTEPAPRTVEAYLHFCTGPRPLGCGDATTLRGAFYPSSARPNGFRLVNRAPDELALEEAEPGISCAIL